MTPRIPRGFDYPAYVESSAAHYNYAVKIPENEDYRITLIGWIVQQYGYTTGTARPYLFEPEEYLGTDILGLKYIKTDPGSYEARRYLELYLYYLNKGHDIINNKSVGLPDAIAWRNSIMTPERRMEWFVRGDYTKDFPAGFDPDNYTKRDAVGFRYVVKLPETEEYFETLISYIGLNVGGTQFHCKMPEKFDPAPYVKEDMLGFKYVPVKPPYKDKELACLYAYIGNITLGYDILQNKRVPNHKLMEIRAGYADGKLKQ